jgi:Topoisomerase 6 subunit A/Spo11, Toprim domain
MRRIGSTFSGGAGFSALDVDDNNIGLFPDAPTAAAALLVVAARAAATDFPKPTGSLASSEAPQNLKFEREDWSLYRTVEGLQQKAGVPAKRLRRLVLKELADNGLDIGAHVSVGDLPDGGYFIEDDGSGIEGTPKDIARLFSIARPMVSTKLLRLPTRGALGNGLRVVAGAVLASNGSLVVITRNQRIVLCPQRDGSTTVVSVTPVEHPLGTRIEIVLGPSIPSDTSALGWAKEACRLAGRGQFYLGKSSPHWYDAAQFHELLYATGDRPVRELVATLDGCTGGRAGEIVVEAGLERALCTTVTHKQAARLLGAARSNARQVNPQRLGVVGTEAFPGYAYGYSDGVVRFGSAEPKAEIPFVVEAWAYSGAAYGAATKTTLCAYVNRTQITGAIEAARDKRNIDAFGCGLHHIIAAAPKDAQFDIRLNVTTPYMPITSDGKEPNLEPFLDGIVTAVGKAVRKAHRPNAGNKQTQKDVVLEHLEEAIAKISNNGQYRFNQRQILYALRPIVKAELDKELTTQNFTQIITEYEDQHGEIPGMYREPRGSIYHPHLSEHRTLGTLMVEQYNRPAWTFNKLLYIEKEGFLEALKDEEWPERHDCAVLSSKGFSTRAARDLIDKLAEHDEPVTVFCVHDADAHGTMIYQTLQEETKARGARKITITNLGLEPWEAEAMGLETEDVEEGDRRKPVADYVQERHDGGHWEDWLQTHRVELNAMTTPEFIAWLDLKMAEHGDGKLVPPAEVLTAELDKRIEDKVRADIRERILREARFEDQVAKAVAAIKTPSGAVLAKGVRRLFKQEPEREWRDAIEAEAKKAAQ